MGSPPSKRKPDEASETTSGDLHSNRSYPRKRVAIACDVCRTRKTRCDAAKPSCSFCSDNGIPCRYTGPSSDDRKSPVETEYTKTLRRLDGIQTTLNAVAAAVGIAPDGSPLAPSASTRINSLSSTHLASRSKCTTLWKKPISQMPSLLVFKALVPSHSLDSWSYDCSKDFFRLQMAVENDLCNVERTWIREVDLSRPHLWRLQRSFVENFLKWLPLFDHATATQYFHDINIEGPADDGPAAAVVLMMYANGALSLDERRYIASSMELPGFDYYMRAARALRAQPKFGEDLRPIQAYIMMSIYMLLAMRPLESWKMIRQASQACIFLLKAQVVNQRPEYTEAFNRIYWICYIFEGEFEVCLDLPFSGLRAYEDIVSMPTSHYEEEGMYNLLAQSSLRRLMCEVIDAVGLRGTAATYAPVVTLELHNQIENWYQRLPSSLHFPLDHSVLFDMRRAFLRCVYYSLKYVTFWPFVARCRDIIHEGSSNVDIPVGQDDDYLQMQQGANECLEAARNYLKVAEEIITQKVINSHVILRSYFAAVMILLLVHSVTQPPLTSTTADSSLILHAIQNLEVWNIVPFMQRPLEELNRIAHLKGISG